MLFTIRKNGEVQNQCDVFLHVLPPWRAANPHLQENPYSNKSRSVDNTHPSQEQANIRLANTMQKIFMDILICLNPVSLLKGKKSLLDLGQWHVSAPG